MTPATTRPPRRFARILGLLLLLLAAAAAAAGWLAFREYAAFRDGVLPIGRDEIVFEVHRGDAFRDVLANLRKAGVTHGHDLAWEALAWEMGVVTRLQVGEYALNHGITPRRLFEKLERGLVIQHRFTIVEGWNFRELRAAIAREDALVQTLADLDDEALMAELGHAGVHPEGRFLPETYHFTRGTEDRRVLQRAFLSMQRYLEAAWPGRRDGLPIDSPEEALILASIVEKETGLASERPQIAGVFVRRLHLGMKLQTDPTVIYGIGPDFDGNITRAHLRQDTPWNTYVHAGLPPTPIAMPGREAIDAVLHPAEGEALYFVARGDGSHVFSRTLAEHNRAVRRYQLGRL